MLGCRHIRLNVISSLDHRFDCYLAQPEHLRPLMIALNDEAFVVRQAAVAAIRRLTKLNPAYVLPTLRRMLIRLLTELRYSNDSRAQEKSVILLGQILCTSRRLVQRERHHHAAHTKHAALCANSARQYCTFVRVRVRMRVCVRVCFLACVWYTFSLGLFDSQLCALRAGVRACVCVAGAVLHRAHA